ncbi:type VI secretion system baseplate subunit TssE [Aquisalimonas asiatica]|uniref:Type VI secretion system protein n=1 Tax=Aquisalimonas asiatica TaxID=406100 RepID=A0A1H8UIX2_9GAMM|nr:type VI secretion system baseplate subunit TssE [Aquisalimonas asiatica]SEP03172.1 type VI secretion system protein [Aquisalimonas asiatica]
MKAGILDVLLGRFDDGTVVDARAVTSPHAQLASVRGHIRRLISARQGSLVHMPEYGAPGLPAVYSDIPYASAALGEDVRRLVTTHEPRVRDVAVTVEPGCPERGFVVSLRIGASLRSGEPLSLAIGLRESGEPAVLDEETPDGHEAGV